MLSFLKYCVIGLGITLGIAINTKTVVGESFQYPYLDTIGSDVFPSSVSRFNFRPDLKELGELDFSGFKQFGELDLVNPTFDPLNPQSWRQIDFSKLNPKQLHYIVDGAISLVTVVGVSIIIDTVNNLIAEELVKFFTKQEIESIKKSIQNLKEKAQAIEQEKHNLREALGCKEEYGYYPYIDSLLVTCRKDRVTYRHEYEKWLDGSALDGIHSTNPSDGMGSNSRQSASYIPLWDSFIHNCYYSYYNSQSDSPLNECLLYPLLGLFSIAKQVNRFVYAHPVLTAVAALGDLVYHIIEKKDRYDKAAQRSGEIVASLKDAEVILSRTSRFLVNIEDNPDYCTADEYMSLSWQVKGNKGKGNVKKDCHLYDNKEKEYNELPIN